MVDCSTALLNGHSILQSTVVDHRPATLISWVNRIAVRTNTAFDIYVPGMLIGTSCTAVHCCSLSSSHINILLIVNTHVVHVGTSLGKLANPLSILLLD